MKIFSANNAPTKTTHSPQPNNVRPEKHTWDVQGTKVEDTATLLNMQLPAEGADTRYRFQTQLDQPRTRLGAIVEGAAVGAGLGAALGGTLLLAGAVLSPFIIIAGGDIDGIVGLAGGALALSTAVGAFSGFGADLEAPEHVIDGKLIHRYDEQGNRSTEFLIGGQLNEKVDVARYANASMPEIADAEEKPVWRDALMGAAYGAGSTVVGVTGLGTLATMAGGAYLADKASGGSSGAAVLGGTLGLALGAGSIAAVNTVGWKAFGAIAAGAGLAGAVLGPLVLPRVRQQEALEAAYEGHWWSPQPEDPAG